MKVWMIGGHGFGRAVAKQLLDDGNEIVLCTTQDEKMAGLCKDAGAGVGAGPIQVANADPEIMVSAHNHMWVRQEWIDEVEHGCVGYHPSLLPLHRGKDAIRWTIHMKEPVAGGTVYRLEGDEADTGPILKQDWCHVRPGWTASDLWREELFPMGVRLIANTVNEISLTGSISERPQDEELATWEPAWDRPKLKEAS